jgi:hypothetical protein
MTFEVYQNGKLMWEFVGDSIEDLEVATQKTKESFGDNVIVKAVR